MAVALVGTSHSPLMSANHPGDDVVAAVEEAFSTARDFIRSFEPDLVVIFGTDHFNGVFYEMLPCFCIGAAATSVGDWGTQEGPLDVDHDAALAIATHVLDSEVDTAISERMQVDHAFAQPLQILFGGIDRVRTVPIFVNGAAAPFGPARRARLLGRAVGEAVRRLDRRVLLMASGGLSHDPPVPQLAGAEPELAERLIAGRNPAPEVRAAREQRTIETARRANDGTGPIKPLNPTFDLDFLDLLRRGDLERVDQWSNQWLLDVAGRAAHEIRTWIAAYAALAAAGGPYQMELSFYREIPEWIAGFAVTTARPVSAASSTSVVE